jgi:TonB family protein
MARFSPNQLLSNRYILKENIGKGGFADVYKAEDTQANNAEVAVKILAPQSGLASAVRNSYLNEFTTTLDLSHQNLLTPKHYGEFGEICYIIMPLCAAGSLDNCILESNNPATTNSVARTLYFPPPKETYLAERELAKVLKETAAGLEYIHSKGVLHNDVKPGNILIGNNGDYMLSDFGISSKTRMTAIKNSIDRSKMENDAHKTNSALSVAYAATELFGDYQVNTAKTDVFSLGVTIYEVATGNLPWMGQGGVLLNNGASIPNLPNRYSAEFNQIVRSCMDKIPENRPHAKELSKWADFFLQNNYWSVKERTKKMPIGARATAGASSLKRLSGAVAFIALCLGGGGYYLMSDNQQNKEGYTEISASQLGGIAYNSPNITANDGADKEQIELDKIDVTAITPDKAALPNKNAAGNELPQPTPSVSQEQPLAANSYSNTTVTSSPSLSSLVVIPVEREQPQVIVETKSKPEEPKPKENSTTTSIEIKREEAKVAVAEKNAEDEILVIVEKQPEFAVGGVKGLYQWIGKNIKYPPIALKKGIEGKAIVQFVVETDGQITNINCLQGPEGGCRAEAVRVVSKMPKWIPGKQQDRPVRVKYRLPIIFKLEE